METILITNDSLLANYADSSGVSRVMVDLEIIGKKKRQGHLNTVISNHTPEDVSIIKKSITNAKLLVRINPIHEGSKREIDLVINNGADVVMLPMFKTSQEVSKFIDYVGNRAITCLLLETPEALVRIDEILKLKGIDEIHVGLNDLHLALNLDFMFELLSGGIVEYISKKVCGNNIKFGFGGIARLGQGTLDSRMILSEHYRLNSSMVILSRDFKGGAESYEELREKIFLKEEVDKISSYFTSLSEIDDNTLTKNKNILYDMVQEIVQKR